MKNCEKYFGTPAKIAQCIIEPAIEEGYLRGSEECLRVTTIVEGEPILLGIFDGPWEFEEWLCSDMSYEEWVKQRNLNSY